MGAREFALMKPGAILINTCRGPVVDEAALHPRSRAARSRAPGSTCWWRSRPPRTTRSSRCPNVTLTPHSAGPTWENWTARFRNGFDNIQRVAAGRAPKWVIPELQGPQP